MLQCWNYVVTVRNNITTNVATLCFAKNRRCDSFCVTSPTSSAWHGNEAVYFKTLVNMAQIFAYNLSGCVEYKILTNQKSNITKGYKVQATTIESQNAFDPMLHVLCVA